jgi:hypothetical protein
LHRQLKPNGKGIVSVNVDKKAKGSSSKASSKSAPVDEEEREDDEEEKDSDGEESSNAKARREKRAAKSTSVVSHTDGIRRKVHGRSVLTVLSWNPRTQKVSLYLLNLARPNPQVFVRSQKLQSGQWDQG